MKTLEKRLGGAIESLEDIRVISIKKPAYEPCKSKDLGVKDMAEYSCDAACDNCHCATYIVS